MSEVSIPKIKAGVILRDLKIAEPDEISVEDIAWTRGAIVVEDGLRGADARLVYTPGVLPAIIRVNATIPHLGRRRFAVAHELGHLELKHNPSAPTQCGEKQFIMWYKSQNDQEVEANLFAAELLMPEAMFSRELEGTIPSFELIEELANEFQTTLTASAIRYIDLCGEQCAIVFSTGGKIIWSRRSLDFHRWIQPGRRLSSYSLAADFFERRELSEKIQTVRRDAWVENASDRESIKEQSRALRSYDSVLSLLWIPYEFTK
jgi:Zn-dependent peptidase ImmA (M78 family)